MTRISSQKTRRAILATDLPWDPALVPEKLVLYDSLGNIIDLEHVAGPQGPPGPPGGADVLALASKPVLDVGVANQIRAGRQLLTTDFTTMGLSIPTALWNLGDGTDSSGNGRHLTNKGAVTFVPGINGFAATAARFVGSVAQGLYITDTGVADPFRIKAGSMGCWMKSAKRGTNGQFIGKWAAAQGSYLFYTANNVLYVQASSDGSNSAAAVGTTDLVDDRWHFVVGTFDGLMIRGYVDGILETVAPMLGPLFSGNAPLNVGIYGLDGANNGLQPHYGWVDEAFITPDILSEEQVRNLYCAKIPHVLGIQPTRASVAVRVRRRGGPLVAGDFPIQPARLHNFTGGLLADEGSNGVVPAISGTVIAVPGADGLLNGGYYVAGNGNLFATDAGLPAGLNARSYGCWLKTSPAGLGTVFSWGTQGTGDAKIYISGGINAASASSADQLVGGIVNDGQWHHVVAVENNAAIDGVKRKLYVDGHMTSGSLVMNAIVLAGANRFRVGANPDVSNPYTGAFDGIFIISVALTAEEVYALYAKGSQALGPSPKNVGDHVEVMTSAHVLAIFDTLDSVAQVDLGVAA